MGCDAWSSPLGPISIKHLADTEVAIKLKGYLFPNPPVLEQRVMKREKQLESGES